MESSKEEKEEFLNSKITWCYYCEGDDFRFADKWKDTPVKICKGCGSWFWTFEDQFHFAGPEFDGLSGPIKDLDLVRLKKLRSFQ